MRLKNIRSSFVACTFDDTYMKEQDFADYTSKYLDLHDKIKTNTLKESVSILDEIDFELELIHRDDSKVACIMSCWRHLKMQNRKTRQKSKSN